MLGIGQKKLLIVEDDDDTYECMRLALDAMLTTSCVDAAIERAVTLEEAKRKLRSWNPHVVSTDMGFPLQGTFGRLEQKAGVALVSYIRKRHPSVGCLVYSGADKETVEKWLRDAAIKNLPVIVSKSAIEGGGTTLFAKVVTSMLLEC